MPAIPLVNIHSYEHYVHDLDRAVEFYRHVLGFEVIGRSHPAAEVLQGVRRLVLSASKAINVIVSQSLSNDSVVGRYLALHPEGMGCVNFRVSDIRQAISALSKRGANIIYPPHTTYDRAAQFYQISIATPSANVRFRFIDDSFYHGFGTAFVMEALPGEYLSPFGYEAIDHITSNFLEMESFLLWLRDVMGFEQYWDIEFHTRDVNPAMAGGSGLNSTVMWHPASGIKFANNEPKLPCFENSQQSVFWQDNRGAGIQHIALRVPNIVPVIRAMRRKGGLFLPVPEVYYASVMKRVREAGFKGRLEERLKTLAKLGILVDGSAEGYLLQIFMQELNKQMAFDEAGPFFYEIIQRRGERGFGAGNFRALFEAIENDQKARGVISEARRIPEDLV